MGDAEAVIIKNADIGKANKNFKATVERYKNWVPLGSKNMVRMTLSRTPFVHWGVVKAHQQVQKPMNSKVHEVIVVGEEVAEGYSKSVERALIEYPDAPYLLTMEDDNLPQADGAIKLLQSINGGIDGKKYDAMAGFYWMKSDPPVPMIFGLPENGPEDFAPAAPIENTVMETNGVPMGFTLFRMEMFKDPKLPRPLFQDIVTFIDGVETRTSQDLFFCNNARKLGYRFGVDTRVLVGHMDTATGEVY